jgi:hypothetical protein
MSTTTTMKKEEKGGTRPVATKIRGNMIILSS